MDRIDVTGGEVGDDGLAGPARTAVVAYDDQGTVTGWSAGARRLLGHRAEDVLGRPLKALLEDADAGAAFDVLFGPSGAGTTTVMRHENGGQLSVELLRLVAGEPGARENLLIVTPLPGVAAAEDPLVDMAFDQFPYAGGLHDLDLKYLRVNQKAEQAWGRPAGELVGNGPYDLMPDATGADVRERMAEALATGEPVHREYHFRMPGEAFDRAWSGVNVPLKDAFGQVKGLYSVGIDVTEQYLARERLSLLNTASLSIGSTLDVGTTARELAEVLVPEVADFVAVDLLDSFFGDLEPASRPPSGAFDMRRVAHLSVLEETPESVLAVGGVETFSLRSPQARVVLMAEPFITPIMDGTGPGTPPDLAFDETRRESGRRHGIHTAMIVPLRARGTTLGIATFLRHRRPEAFSDDDLLLAEEIATRAAMAMDNALRYTRQRHNALTLQNSLLPQLLPQRPALEVAGRYLPSDAQIGVGGDWYDVIPLSGSRVALVVGDVVGHGIQASATMGLLRTAVRTLADIDLPPDELLTHLDDLVSRPQSAHSGAEGPDDPDDEAFDNPSAGATCLVAVYDPVTRRCTMARAGHPPPAVVLPDGTAELLDVPAGPPLGVGGLPFETHEVELPEGSLLALYTDGLVERRGEDVEAGIDRLLTALTEPRQDLEVLCDGVLGRMEPSGSEDDVALLVARTRALDPSQVVMWELRQEPAAAGLARDLAGGKIAEWGLEDVAFSAEIVVSELVTNAIRYGTGSICLRLILEDSLIIEVTDGSNTYPRLRRARGYDEGGRGLLLVAQLSRAWGTRAVDNGKVVWAEQALATSWAP